MCTPIILQRDLEGSTEPHWLLCTAHNLPDLNMQWNCINRCAASYLNIETIPESQIRRDSYITMQTATYIDASITACNEVKCKP